MQQSNEPTIHCPKCNSTQLTANKKGFSGTKAVAGAVLTGGIGLLAGTLGSNKVRITCLACGHVFKPGDGKLDGKDPVKKEMPEMPKFTIEHFYGFIILIVIIVFIRISCT